uniref:Uncharacterized protein n=1 Tax=Opuntia streptacantha TaxID=393608 RepID=A0A7C9AR26_OPUST
MIIFQHLKTFHFLVLQKHCNSCFICVWVDTENVFRARTRWIVIEPPSDIHQISILFQEAVFLQIQATGHRLQEKLIHRSEFQSVLMYNFPKLMGLIGPIFQLALIFRVKGKVKSISPIESLMLGNNCVI